MKAPEPDGNLVAVLSYDEKPGIQAIGTTAPDLPPIPGKHPAVSRDYEYVRHGTVTLMAAIDLLDGQVLGSVVDRHTSAAFIDFLRTVDDPTRRIASSASCWTTTPFTSRVKRARTWKPGLAALISCSRPSTALG